MHLINALSHNTHMKNIYVRTDIPSHTKFDKCKFAYSHALRASFNQTDTVLSHIDVRCVTEKKKVQIHLI